jgi:hypothetical protein
MRVPLLDAYRSFTERTSSLLASDLALKGKGKDNQCMDYEGLNHLSYF